MIRSKRAILEYSGARVRLHRSSLNDQARHGRFSRRAGALRQALDTKLGMTGHGLVVQRKADAAFARVDGLEFTVDDEDGLWLVVKGIQYEVTSIPHLQNQLKIAKKWDASKALPVWVRRWEIPTRKANQR